MKRLRQAAWVWYTFAGPAWTLFLAILLVGIVGSNSGHVP